jgi:cytochrome c oxidase subunit 2
MSCAALQRSSADLEHSGRRHVSPTRLRGRQVRSTKRTRTTRTALLGLAALSTVTLAGCTTEQRDEFSRAYLLEPVTDEGERILSLWVGSWIAAMAVGILVWGLILWAVVAYNRKRKPGYPVQTRYNLPIEILWTVLPFIMVGVLFFFTVRDQNEILELSDDPDVTVNVVGFRWSWAFNYLDQDAYEIGLPATLNATASGDFPGVDPSEGYTGPTMYLPVGERVRFVLTTPDVIHSFYVPDFLMKMDHIPGRTNVFELTPNTPGTYVGKCAELCGLDHSRMLFNVKVVERDEFEAHIEELKAKGQSGIFESPNVSSSADEGLGKTLTDTDKGREAGAR